LNVTQKSALTTSSGLSKLTSSTIPSATPKIPSATPKVKQQIIADPFKFIKRKYNLSFVEGISPINHDSSHMLKYLYTEISDEDMATIMDLVNAYHALPRVPYVDRLYQTFTKDEIKATRSVLLHYIGDQNLIGQDERTNVGSYYSYPIIYNTFWKLLLPHNLCLLVAIDSFVLGHKKSQSQYYIWEGPLRLPEFILPTFIQRCPEIMSINLTQMVYLNDEIMNSFGVMLEDLNTRYIEHDRLKQSSSMLIDVDDPNATKPNWYYPTQFYEKLINPLNTAHEQQRIYERQPVHNLLITNKKLYIPINVNNSHWVLCIIDLETKVMLYIDPLGNTDEAAIVFRQLMLYLIQHGCVHGIEYYADSDYFKNWNNYW